MANAIYTIHSDSTDHRVLLDSVETDTGRTTLASWVGTSHEDCPPVNMGDKPITIGTAVDFVELAHETTLTREERWFSLIRTYGRVPDQQWTRHFIESGV